MFTAVLKGIGETRRPVVAQLDVRELGTLRPVVLIADVDTLDVDPLEVLRRLRFVLPTCLIAVYTADHHRSWGLACHLAGANCLLSKDSSVDEMIAGLEGALASGCYTDPRLVA